MPDYRVYFVDISGGIADAQWLDASSDEEAMTQANALKRHFAREVWQYQREVGRLLPAFHN
jgi:hypothetical protein